MSNYQHSFIFRGFDKMLNLFQYLSLVQLFKFVATELYWDRDESKQKQIGIDVFICFKWTLLLLFWVCDFGNWFTEFVVWYLIITNVFTYFYYHVWDDKKERSKLRFLYLFLSIAFSTTCFAYLYNSVYYHEFQWAIDSNWWNSIQFSLSNSLTADYQRVKLITEFADFVTLMQLSISFVFLTIILSISIPEKSK